MRSCFCQPLFPDGRTCKRIQKLDWIFCWDKSELQAIWFQHWNHLDWNHLKAANGRADSDCSCHKKLSHTSVFCYLCPDQRTQIKQIHSREKPQRKKQNNTKIFETDCICAPPHSARRVCPKRDSVPALTTPWHYSYSWLLNQRGWFTVTDVSPALRVPA